jgi:S1/P1 Nuclease
MKAAVYALLLVVLPADALAWGQEGHSIIAEIAQRRLDAETLRKVKMLLDEEISLASIASWADDYRAVHPETGSWHFVVIPDNRSSYEPSIDCKSNGCVVAVISHFKDVLADCSKSTPDRPEALKFLAHFVGNIHQPLHASSRSDPYTGKDDRGGNDVPVTFFGQPTNLHALWDTGLILRTAYGWGAYVLRPETSWFPGRDLGDLQGGKPADWAVESHRLAHETAYDIPVDAVVGTQYLAKASPMVDRQVAVAGLRLGKLLEDTLRPVCCP